MTRPTLPLTIPTPDATHSELVEHFIVIRNIMACHSYDDAVHMCLTCGRIDENSFDKQYGHARFCSQVCWDVMLRKDKLYADARKLRFPEPEKKGAK